MFWNERHFSSHFFIYCVNVRFVFWEKVFLTRGHGSLSKFQVCLIFAETYIKHVSHNFQVHSIWPWPWTVKNNQMIDSDMSYSARSQSTTPSANEMMLMKNIMVGCRRWCFCWWWSCVGDLLADPESC